MSRKWVSKVFLESGAVLISLLFTGKAPFVSKRIQRLHHLVIDLPYLQMIFYFFRKEQAPSVMSTPSNPLYPVENDNITL